MTIDRPELPSWFARYVLRLPLYPVQERIVDAMAGIGSRVTARTCNESGKTTRLIAVLIGWHAYVFPRLSGSGGVVTTSGSWNQVKNQLVPALRTLFSSCHALREYEVMEDRITYRGFPQWVGFATNNPGAAEGFHGTPEFPLLVIEDEAKSVPDEVNKALEDRCNPQRIGLFSSPGGTDGHFYRSHTSDDGWTRFKVAASDCPHISRESIERRIAKHGTESPLVRSMIFAEFMESVEGGIITLADLDRLAEAPLSWDRNTAVRHCFCDFAAGGDENVIAFRQGNRVRIVDAWTDKNTMSAVGRFVTRFNELQRTAGLKQEEIEGDADGLGGPMIDRLAEAGWSIGRFHGGSGPRFDAHHKNLITEVWHSGAARIKARDILIDPDTDLRAQLINRKSKWESSGKLWMETKDELRRRGVGSPDRADAVLGAIAANPHRQPYNLVKSAQEESLYGQEYLEYTPAEDGCDYPVGAR